MTPWHRSQRVIVLSSESGSPADLGMDVVGVWAPVGRVWDRRNVGANLASVPVAVTRKAAYSRPFASAIHNRSPYMSWVGINNRGVR